MVENILRKWHLLRTRSVCHYSLINESSLLSDALYNLTFSVITVSIKLLFSRCFKIRLLLYRTQVPILLTSMATTSRFMVWVLFPENVHPFYSLLSPAHVPIMLFPADLLRLAGVEAKNHQVVFLGSTRPSTPLKGEIMKDSDNMIFRAGDSREIFLRIEAVAPAASAPSAPAPSAPARPPDAPAAVSSGVLHPHNGCAANASCAPR